LQGKLKVIAVNDSFKLAPWADVLYGCDLGWWQLHKGVPEFAGLKLTHDRSGPQHYKDLHRVEILHPVSNELLLDQPSHLGAGGNGGFQAFNLIIQFGVTRIMLVGIDCSIDNGPHWHGRHPVPLTNPLESNVARWRKAFNEASGRIAALGVEVINCSPVSTVNAYPKLSVDETLKRWAL
jgi:hypothetical protein